MPPTTEESSAPSGSGGASTEANYQLPWTAIPRFIPGTTDVTEYAKKLQFLAAMWPKESIALLAPRAALLCEGTAFKKVSSLPADKLKSSDDSGVKLLVTTLGGAWGRSEVELKYDVFEKAIFGTIQKSDESNDSYLARHDVHFEELLAQGVSFEEIRAYILLRQSALSAEDRKKIVVEMSGALKYDKVRSAIRLLGSRFFSDLQGQRGAFRSKTYDANMVEDAGNEDAERAYNVNATQGAGDDNDYELDPEYVEALAATDDQDALVVASFEEELEGFFQDTPEMQEALVSYLEARSRLLSKRKVRGFWPVSGHKGFKGSGKGGKGKGKGKSGRDQLLARIAKSTCRACGERGHWKAECPKYGKPGSMSASSKTEAATTVAEVDQGPAAAFLAGHFDESQDLEVLTQLPEEAVSLAEACIVTRSTLPSNVPRRLQQMIANLKTPKPFAAQDTSIRRAGSGTKPWTEDLSRRSETATLSDLSSSVALLSTSPVEAILDTGASRCVMGHRLLEPFLSQLGDRVRDSVRVTRSAVKFRFGNNQTLDSTKRVLVPIRTVDHQVLWLGIEIVPGNTPLLFSKRAIKQLGGIIDTTQDTCCLRRLRRTLQLHSSATGLYLLDLARLSAESFQEGEQQCQHVREEALQSAQENLDSQAPHEPCMPIRQPEVKKEPNAVCTNPKVCSFWGPQAKNSIVRRFRKYPERVNEKPYSSWSFRTSSVSQQPLNPKRQCFNSQAETASPSVAAIPPSCAEPSQDGPEQSYTRCSDSPRRDWSVSRHSFRSADRKWAAIHAGRSTHCTDVRARTSHSDFRQACERPNFRGRDRERGVLDQVGVRSSQLQRQIGASSSVDIHRTVRGRSRSPGNGASPNHGSHCRATHSKEQGVSPQAQPCPGATRGGSLGHGGRSRAADCHGVPGSGLEQPHESDGRDDASDVECHTAAQHEPVVCLEQVTACMDEIKACLTASSSPTMQPAKPRDHVPEGEQIDQRAQALIENKASLAEMRQFLRQVPWHELRSSSSTPRSVAIMSTDDQKRPSAYLTFGLFVHGGVVGVTRVSRQYPWLTQVLVQVVTQTQPNHPFSSISVSCNVKAKPHRDSYNSLDIPNLVIPIMRPQSGGEIWVAGTPGPNQKAVDVMCKGHKMSGTLRCLRDHLLLDPHVWHATMPWSGNRMLVVGFASKAHYKLSSEDQLWLRAQGFPLKQLHEHESTTNLVSDELTTSVSCKSDLRQELENGSHLLQAPALSAQAPQIIEACMNAFTRAQQISWETFEDSLLAYQQPSGPQLDLLEVYAFPDSRLTQSVRDLGGHAQRFTKEQGDLSTIEGQRLLWDIVQKTQPRHIWVAPDCRLWGSWSHFNASRSPTYNQKMLEGRQKETVHLLLCTKLFEWQKRHGRDFHLEQPVGSAMLKEPALSPIVSQSQKINVDMCAFGLQTPVSKRPIKKATTIVSTCPNFLRSLVDKQCKGHPNHQPVAGKLRELGGQAVSQYVASYCGGFARHVARQLLTQGDKTKVLVAQSSDPPLTRKRFKTSVGAPSPQFSHRPQKRSADELPEAEFRSQPSRRVIEPPSMQVPEVLPTSEWKSIFEAAASVTSRASPTLAPPQHEVVSRLIQVLPQYKILQVFIGCGSKSLHYPLGALAVTVAPIRLSFAETVGGQGEVVYKCIGQEDRATMSPDRKRARIRPARHLITVFAQVTPVGDGESPALSPAEARSPNLEGWAPPPVPLHGPAYRNLSPEEKATLRRIHVNLGHPSPSTLARHLQAAKADPRIIEAAREFQCDACVESTQPLHQRPSKLPESREFNDLLGIDGFYFKAKSGYRVYVLHAIDEASCFQQGRRAMSRHASDAIKALNDFWFSWAGVPKRVYLDPAGEFRSEEVLEYFQGQSIQAHVTAAAWQRGRLERHGDVLKDMLERMDTAEPISDDATFDRILQHCIMAKNALARHEGYSPEQIVFGKALRIPGSNTSDEDLTSHALTEGAELEAERHRERLHLRCVARKAFLEADNSQTIRRAALRRSTPLRGPFTPGMWVLYWTKKTSPNRLAAGRWHGPAKVICSEGKSIVWVAHGTTIIRSAPENLRPASLREWQSLTDSTLQEGWKNTGGASTFLDITAPAASSSDDFRAGPDAGSSAPPPAIVPEPTPNIVGPGNSQPTPPADDIIQPEQELTPQVSQDNDGVELGSAPVTAPPSSPAAVDATHLPIENPQDVPVPESDDGLIANPIFLSCEETGIVDEDGDALVQFSTVEAGEDSFCPPLAEDNYPYVLEPLQPSSQQAFCLEVELKSKEVKRWQGEKSPGQLVTVAAAMKRTRAEVSLKHLSPKEVALFEQAKLKEINCWVQTSAIRGILRRKLNPDQILKSRWILTWKAPEEGETQQRAKARLVVLGYQDPKLTEVSRDAPTLSKEGRSIVLQTIASRRFQLSSFDIKTAFLRGKADANNPLAMEPPKELRQVLGLKDDEVCELLGNAYGRVDAPLLFYKELSKQLMALGFTRHPLEPCVFLLQKNNTLHGILGMHVDDGVGGGDSVFKGKIDELQKSLPFGSRKFDSFTFTGIHLQQHADGSIKASQGDYVRSIPAIDIGRPRRQNLEMRANEVEQSKLRGLIGSLQYAVTHTRPDMAAKLGEIQSQTSCPTIQTLMSANKVLREAQETSFVSIRYLPIPVSQVTFVSFGDASFASAKNLNSHQGALICATDENLNRNQEAPVSPVAWSSKRIPRVVRSTLSAEAYAMSKAVDILGWIRALWGVIHIPHFKWQDPAAGFKQLRTATVVTDCKSLYDLVTRLAMPSCEEFRTTLEVLLIKQRCSENSVFRWIPTTLQVADSLTKPMDPVLLRTVLAQGRFRLYDATEGLNKTAQRKEAVQWLSQPSSSPQGLSPKGQDSVQSRGVPHQGELVQKNFRAV